MQEQEAVAIIFTVAIAGGVGALAVALLLRYKRLQLIHRERMAAIEKGAELPPEPVKAVAPWSPRVYLLRGLMWLFTGLALSVFFLGISATTKISSYRMEEEVRAVRRMKEAGASAEDLREYADRARTEGTLPLGWAFLGLVPAGVGAAYLIFYRSESRRP